MNPTVYVLIGPPACGKSTWRSLMGHAMMISSDDIVERKALAEGKTYAAALSELDEKDVNAILRQNIRAAVDRKEDIVIDRTNMTVKSRRRFLSLIPRTYRRVGVVFSFDRDELRERNAARYAQTGKFIPESVIDGFIASYQAPVEGEFDAIINI